MTKHTLIAVGALALVGCESDFTPYEELDRPRLLAIAADGSELAPDDATTLSALVTEANATYQWSWCPLVGTADEGYPCLVTEAELQAAIDAAIGAGQVTVPPFDLGTADTATLDHAIPPAVWQGFCQALQESPLPGPVEFPRCDDKFEVSILLDVDVDGAPQRGRREVALLYDDSAPPNATPLIAGAVAIDPDTNERIDLDGGTLRRGVTYTLELDIGADQIETYARVPVEGGPAEMVLEDLRASWFHDEGGELDHAATSFLDGSTDLDDLRTNEYTTPTAEERAADTARLFVVLRDDRGGTSWLEATVVLQ